LIRVFKTVEKCPLKGLEYVTLMAQMFYTQRTQRPGGRVLGQKRLSGMCKP